MQLRQTMGLLVVTASVSLLGIAGCTSQTDQTNSGSQTQQGESNTQTPKGKPDVIYVPTPDKVVAEMLQLANVSEDDVVYDLGSGDGRIPIMAAKRYGARGVGVEIDSGRIQQARENAREAGMAKSVKFIQQDLFKTDLSEATVVTLYLLPELNVKLRPKLLRELEPGTPIVSHSFDMGEWEPERVVKVGDSTVYLWTVPEKIPEHLR
ncbi:MAG: SAM-dependent methyltransferase [Cyanobacteria bacterium QH_8_48_120]|jgi:SAM-dependent methyltransferase|nr:MAG: SAM-dependent methyltransferase [Cyanobacteria bacterium QH_1_48_107]PSO60757.1 MAG: SAM-dependent methyltransferase [Cyanobacteria bacterium QH_10_48_56]PSO63322.1 MAG: SAM-dependent methyltransferase [Cyanobacteria bacterium QH_6_48_35]PSO64391.1 MAG: SAM-dependent methyltransferase [Cyanobacteria bacterium QH_7_48_89]PSO65439.1 MAG: SAM-dependent methyltransferase [Cyanobacteria bacterium QH_2_48_84]PSO67200.1 MAG: SAM-dependent methyltransferase [Cyanobacteria bacterium QS_1_48_34]